MAGWWRATLTRPRDTKASQDNRAKRGGGPWPRKARSCCSAPSPSSCCSAGCACCCRRRRFGGCCGVAPQPERQERISKKRAGQAGSPSETLACLAAWRAAFSAEALRWSRAFFLFGLPMTTYKAHSLHHRTRGASGLRQRAGGPEQTTTQRLEVSTPNTPLGNSAHSSGGAGAKTLHRHHLKSA